MSDKRTFLLVDINSYFATLLQQENPQLRGKPIAIVKDLGRTCVIAASKEAKKHGVKTGCNIVRARQLAPDLLEMKAEFDLYLSATHKLSRLFASIAPKVNVYSLDEAFIEITDCQRNLYPDSQQLGRDIQQQIRNLLGDWVTANVGIGPNRFLAKMAAEIAPKESVFEINQDNLDLILAEVEFEDVCGIGPRLARKLNMMGVKHPYQIRFYSQQDLETMFGPFWSRELIKMAYGQEPHHLALLDQEFVDSSQSTAAARQPAKTASRSITLWDLVDDEQAIKQVLYNLTREVIYKVRQMDMAGRRVAISLSGSDSFKPLYWRDHRTFSTYIEHTQKMFEIIYHQLYQSWQRSFKPIKFRVSLGLLESISQINPSLLPSWQKQEAVESALDKIAQQYGLFTVRSALLAEKDSVIRPEVTGFFGDKQYQLSKLAS